MRSRFILAANRLPVHTYQTSEGGLRLAPSAGGVATALESMLSDGYSRWVGSLGDGRPIDKEKLVRLGMSPQLEPVGLAGDVYARYYNAVSNGGLWPVFHHFQPERLYGKADWRAYQAANRSFADKICSIAQPDDLIWIQDYHLLLLPELLRTAGLKNRIGFFLHVPFARAEDLQLLPGAREVLASLLHADLCGLQTSADVERLQAALAAFGLPALRSGQAQVFPVGIDYAKYHAAPRLPGVRRHAQRLAEKFSGTTLVLSVSRLDYTKGILEQLRAIERLLQRKKRLMGKLVYKLIVSPSREGLSAYRELQQQVQAHVHGINQRFGVGSWQPVAYEYRNVEFEELTAWYARADIMLVTPFIDGMNLVAKEYPAVKQDDDGVLILSRGAGAALELKEALQVSPGDVEDIEQALERAMEMPTAERARRLRALRARVRGGDVFAWADKFGQALLGV